MTVVEAYFIECNENYGNITKKNDTMPFLTRIFFIGGKKKMHRP